MLGLSVYFVNVVIWIYATVGRVVLPLCQVRPLVVGFTNVFRRESHYGENDGNGDVHGLKRHREQSVTPY